MATNTEVKAFIKKFGEMALNECNRRISEGKGFILPSVAMAQSALETNWGTAGIMTRAHAFFGVKAGGSWTGKIYTADTWEVVNGEVHNITANFRAYDTDEESMTDYYNIMTSLSRYSKGVSYGKDPSKWLSAKETITALWKGGYATDELYVNKIMNTINARDLTAWDTKIDGVTFNTVAEPSRELSVLVLEQGALMLTDGGRTIGTDTTNEKAVTLPWANAITVEYDTAYTVTGISPFRMIVGILRGETATLNTIVNEGDTFNLLKGDKFAFYLERENNALVLNLDDLQSELNNGHIKFTNPADLGSSIDNSERYSGPLAFFVEIE